MKKNIVIYTIAFCLLSCQEKRPKYFYLTYNNPISDVVVKGEVKDSLEVGDWAFYNQKNALLSKGRYNYGLKNGEWLYLVDSIYLTLNWSVSLNDTAKFFINYPSKWIVTPTPDKELLFRATFNDTDTLKGKYFLASRITDDTITIKPKDYSYQFVNTIKKHFTVNTLTRLLLKNGRNEIYFNKVDIIRNDKQFLVYEACVEINQITYDFIYSTDDLTNFSGIIFFDVLGGCFIHNTRVINPLAPYKFETLANE